MDEIDGGADSDESGPGSNFPDEVLERVLSLVKCDKDRSSLSLVCKKWYNAERLSRTSVFIRKCYSVSHERVIRRFPNIRAVTLKWSPRFSDFNLVTSNWGGDDVHSWLALFASKYPFLEELRLKKMTVTDESLDFLARSFLNFKALSLSSCEGFSTDGLASIATHCKNLTELDIQENDIDDKSGNWLSCFPENFTSLELLNFASLDEDVSFDALEKLVRRCRSLKVLKLNKNINLEQLTRLLIHAPQLMELRTGSFAQELSLGQLAELENSFKNCKSLHTISISGLLGAAPLTLQVIYPACRNLAFLNLSRASIRSWELAELLSYCPYLRRLWVLDTVKDKGLEAVGSNCPLLEELRVFPTPTDLDDEEAVHGMTESGFLAVSYGCPRLRYVLFFCWQMTNAAVAAIVNNCPDITHFRLCILNPDRPDYLTNEPMDEAFGSVVKTCSKLRRLRISGLSTNLTFEYIGKYAKNLETLSVTNFERLSASFGCPGPSDRGMQCVYRGCPKLRKVKISDF